MGSTTYEWLLREEIRDDPTRWPYAQPTWVFSSRELPVVEGADAPLLPRRLVTPPLELVGCSRQGPFAQLDHRARPAPGGAGVQGSGQRSANRSVAATSAALISGSVQAWPDVGATTSSACGQARCRSQAVTAGVQRS